MKSINESSKTLIPLACLSIKFNNYNKLILLLRLKFLIQPIRKLKILSDQLFYGVFLAKKPGFAKYSTRNYPVLQFPFFQLE
jgi:hypothetical protein